MLTTEEILRQEGRGIADPDLTGSQDGRRKRNRATARKERDNE